ncbi:hypothetical protein, conserved [Trypanosoma brucei brucei TREU927]|uniref:Uncharacterized protein n=1 Tax=Trypanosoma brucei brucei (strain 927/4 GUTat10.1) TaxID=185431 RepID=Q580J1_TRYB2|nr:hypothetical protein, conserved [Trypanosoma brucei brucei TREU927]AAX79305.1 hypothetical protein, conserved [Trypanosoma brucei]AAZ10484.1 hypothetical protein, conserved [Trypanosoma brucei brucei TREU927]
MGEVMILREKQEDSMIVLSGVRKQADLLLMSRYFVKLQRHVEKGKRKKHLGRCATLLKHNAVRRLVVTHFLRWFYNTRRHLAGSLGFEGLPRIVVFPTNQDFVNLGVRYFQQWREWLRRIRQRRCTNTELLKNKTRERQLLCSFHQWRCFVHQQREERLARRLYELTQQNEKLLTDIEMMEQHCEGQQEREEAFKSLLTNMEAHRNRQFRELENYRQAVREAVSLLHVSSWAETNSQGVAPQAEKGQNVLSDSVGDEESLQLLRAAATDVHKAVSELRSVLPMENEGSGTLSDVVQSVCQHISKLDGTFDELMDELHSSSTLTKYMRNVLQSTGENILAISQKCSPPNLFRGRVNNFNQTPTPEQSREPHRHNVTGGSFVDWETLELLKDQLSHGDTLMNGVPSTVAVLENVDDALKCLYERQQEADEYMSNQQKTANCTREQVHVLAEAAEQAVGLIQSWCSMTAQHQRDTTTIDAKEELTGVKVCELAALLRYESEVASDALSKIRHILLSTRPPPKMSAQDVQSKVPSTGDASTETSRFVSYSGLVKMVQGLHEQQKEAVDAYETVYNELQQLIFDLSAIGSGRESCASVSSESCNDSRLNSLERPQLSISRNTSDYLHYPMKRAEPIINAVRDCINLKDIELKELRSVIRRSVVALSGGTYDGEEFLGENNGINSSVARFPEGTRLLTMCEELGRAVMEAKTAMKANDTGKFCMHDMVVQLQNKLKGLQMVEAECVSLMKGLNHVSTLYDNGVETEGRSSVAAMLRRWELTTVEQKVGVVDEQTSKVVASRHENIPVGGNDDDAMRCSEILRTLLRGVRRTAEEFLGLHGACAELLTVLDGTHVGPTHLHTPPCDRDMIQSLARHTKELKKVLNRHAAETSDKSSWKGSVSDRLVMLTAKVALLQSEKETLRDEVARCTDRHSSLIKKLTKEVDRLNQVNQKLLDGTEKLSEQKGIEERLARRRAVHIARLLERVVPRVRLGGCLVLWMKYVCERRKQAVYDAREAEETNSLQVARKQHQQNLILRMLAVVLNSLPSTSSLESEAPVTELLLLHLIRTENHDCLDELVQRRLGAVAVWRRSLKELLRDAAALKEEAWSLREAMTGSWKTQLGGLLHEVSDGIHTAVAFVNEQRSMNNEALRNQVLGTETLSRKNRELKRNNTKLLQELLELQRVIATRDERIIKLERENRNIQLSCILTDNDSSTTIGEGKKDDYHRSVVAANTHWHDQERAERVMVSSAKRLAVETINAIAGKDSVGSIAEVAELTAELYNRTAVSLEAICNAHPAARRDFLQVAEACLADLQNLQEVRHEIVERLPELLRVPYID